MLWTGDLAGKLLHLPRRPGSARWPVNYEKRAGPEEAEGGGSEQLRRKTTEASAQVLLWTRVCRGRGARRTAAGSHALHSMHHAVTTASPFTKLCAIVGARNFHGRTKRFRSEADIMMDHF